MVSRIVKVAVVQATPAPFDLAAGLARVVRALEEAGKAGDRLVLFPEAYLPTYPRGFGFGMVVGSRSQPGRQLWQRLWEQCVAVPGPVTQAIAEACRSAGVYAGVGVIEREGQLGRGTLYCTLLLFGPDGRLLGRHRKLRPTGAERLIWGEGDGSSLKVYETAVGRVGGLICWENYMPLARMALYGQGVEVYLAPTADARDTWQATLRHIACEGRCFVLGCNQYVTRSLLPGDLGELEEMRDQPEVLCRGGSAIIGPLGEVLAGPVYDREEVLRAALDLDEVVRAKLDFDVAGHYARPDVFRLIVDTKSRKSVDFEAE